MAKIITEKKYRFELSATQKKERLDVYLTRHIENSTRTKIQKLIEAEYVYVNSKLAKSNYKIQPNDVIDVTIPISPRPEKAEPEDIPLNIVYEDEYLIIVNKPAGIVVHPSFGNYTGTLVNALLHHCNGLSSINDPHIRPGIVHRIDKDTSGLLVVAKDDFTHATLAKQFSKHTINREYYALTWGHFKEKSAEINFKITRSKSDRKKFTHSSTEGKEAITYYEVVKEYDFTTLVKLKLKTGRTHQIRVHLAAINHPIFGDPTYGGRVIVYGSQLPKIKSRVDNLLSLINRQALHAKTLGFIHPHTKEHIQFDSMLPPDIEKILSML